MMSSAMRCSAGLSPTKGAEPDDIPASRTVRSQLSASNLTWAMARQRIAAGLPLGHSLQADSLMPIARSQMGHLMTPCPRRTPCSRSTRRPRGRGVLAAGVGADHRADQQARRLCVLGLIRLSWATVKRRLPAIAAPTHTMLAVIEAFMTARPPASRCISETDRARPASRQGCAVILDMRILACPRPPGGAKPVPQVIPAEGPCTRFLHRPESTQRGEP